MAHPRVATLLPHRAIGDRWRESPALTFPRIASLRQHDSVDEESSAAASLPTRSDPVPGRHQPGLQRGLQPHSRGADGDGTPGDTVPVAPCACLMEGSMSLRPAIAIIVLFGVLEDGYRSRWRPLPSLPRPLRSCQRRRLPRRRSRTLVVAALWYPHRSTNPQQPWRSCRLPCCGFGAGAADGPVVDKSGDPFEIARGSARDL